MAKFPAPYINDVKEGDAMMIMVDQDRTEIGARPSGMPKDSKSEKMGIVHVGMEAK